MFNLSGSEIVFLLLIALVVLGPERLPDAMRRFGKTYSEVKKMSAGFQSELKSALDEPMREMRETADAVRKAANFDLDGGDASAATTGPADAMAAATPAGNEPPLANQKPFHSVIISGGDAAAAPAASAPAAAAPAASEPDAASVADASGVAGEVASEPASADAAPIAEKPPIVRAPGINFASANPRPTAPMVAKPSADGGDALVQPSTDEAEAE
jgi:sec-independent protein translocase protein TatB